MDYILTLLETSFTGGVTISEKTYNEIVSAQIFVTDCAAIEEKYDAMCENFYELERDMIDITNRHMIFNYQNLDFWNDVGLINRRTMNFLTTTRMYIDQIGRQMIKIYGRKSQEIKVFEEIIADIKMKRLGFRTLEALRNHAQHAGYPIQGLSIGSTRSTASKPIVVTHDIKVQISIEELEKDTRIDKNLIDELKKIPDGYYFKPLMREYMEGMSEIHDVVRDTLAEKISEHEGAIAMASNIFKDEYPDQQSLVSLAVVAIEGSKVKSKKYFAWDHLERRKYFCFKNQYLARLKNRTVVS